MSDRIRSPSPIAYPLSCRSSPDPAAYERYSSPQFGVQSARHSRSYGDISCVDHDRRASRGSRDSLSSCPSPRFRNYSDDLPEQERAGLGHRAESPSRRKSASHDDIYSSHKRVSKLQQDLVSANKKIERMDVLYEETNKRKGRLQEELLEACTKVAKLEATCASYQEKEAHHREELVACHERNGKLELDVLSAFKKVSQLESELEAVEGKKCNVQRDRIVAHERISLLEATIEKTKRQDWPVKGDEKVAELGRKVAELEAKITMCTRENEELRKDASRAKSRNVVVEDELNKSRIEKANISSELCEVRETPVKPDKSIEILLEELNKFKELYQDALKTNPEANDYKKLLVQVEHHKEECSRANKKLHAMLEYESKYREEKVRAEETRVELSGAERKLTLAEQQLQKALKEKAAFAMEIGKSNDRGLKCHETLTKMEKNATHFKSAYEDSEKRAREFDAQLRTVSKERLDLAERCQDLAYELQETDAEVEGMLTVSEDLKIKLDFAENAVITAEQQCAKLAQDNQALSEAKEESTGALSQLKSELTRCKRQLNEHKDSADAWVHKEKEGNKRVKQLSLEVEETNEMLEKKSLEVTELESKLKVCQNEKEGVVDEFYNLQDKMAAMEKQLSRVERENTGRESEREELESNLSRNHEEMRKLRKELEEQKSESEIAFRKSQGEGLKAKQCVKELESLQAKFDATSAKLSDVERKYDAIVGERQELRREILKAESDVTQLQLSFNLVNKEKDELVSEVERSSSNKSKRDSVVVKLESDLLEVKDLHAQLVERNQEDQVKLKKQTRELESAVERSEAKSAQVDDLVGRCEALKLERKNIRENIVMLEEQRALLQTQLDKEVREKDNLRDELNETTRKVKRREENMELLEQKVQEQGDVLEKGNRRIREEQGQMRLLKQELEMQMETSQEKCRELESVKVKLEALQQDCDGKKKEILDSKNTIARLESRVSKLEREKTELVSELENRGSNIAKQSEGFTKLQKQLKDVKEGLANSQQQFDELQVQSKRQSDENRVLFKQQAEKSADCVELETKMKELQSCKIDLSREVKKHQEKCKEFEKQTEIAFREQLKLTEELKSSEEIKQRTCKEVVYLKEQLKEYKNLYEANLKDAVVHRDSLEKKTHQHQDLRKKYSKRATELSELEKRLEEAKAENTKLKKECFMKHTKVAKLEQLLQNAMQENEAFSEMENEFHDAQEDLKERSEEIEDYEVEVQTLKHRICGLEALNATLEKSNAVLKESNETARVEESLKKLSELEMVYRTTSMAKRTLELQLEEATNLLSESETQAKEVPTLQQKLQRSQQELCDMEFERTTLEKENRVLKEYQAKLEDKMGMVEGEKARLMDELKKTQNSRKKIGYSRGGLFVGKPEAEFNSSRPEVVANLPEGFQTSTPLTSPRIPESMSRSFHEDIKSKPEHARKYSLDSTHENSALHSVNGRLSTSLDNLTLDPDWQRPSRLNEKSRQDLKSETVDISFESLIGSEVSSDSSNVREMIQQLEKPSPTDGEMLSRSAEDWETVSDISSAAWTVDESGLTDVGEADLSDTASVKSLQQHFETSAQTPPKLTRISSDLLRTSSLTTLNEKHDSTNFDDNTKSSDGNTKCSDDNTKSSDGDTNSSDGNTKSSDVCTSESDVCTNPDDDSPNVGTIVEVDVEIIETDTKLSDVETKPLQLITLKSPNNSDSETKPTDIYTSPSDAPSKSPNVGTIVEFDVEIIEIDTTSSDAERKSPQLITSKSSTNPDDETKLADVCVSESDVSTNPSLAPPNSANVGTIVEFDVEIIETDTLLPDAETKPLQLMTSKSPNNSDGETKPTDVYTSPSDAPPKSLEIIEIDTTSSDAERKFPQLITSKSFNNRDGETKPADVCASEFDLSTNPSPAPPHSHNVGRIVEFDVEIIETDTTSSDAERKNQQMMTSKSPTNSDSNTKPRDVSTSPYDSSTPTRSRNLGPSAKPNVDAADAVALPSDFEGKHLDTKIVNVSRNSPSTPFAAVPKTPVAKRNSFVDSAVRYTEVGMRQSSHGSQFREEDDIGTKSPVKDNNKLQVKQSGTVKPKLARVNVRNMKSLWDEKLMEPQENKRKGSQPIRESSMYKETRVVLLSPSKETVHENSGISGEVNVGGSGGEAVVTTPKQAKVSDLVNLFQVKP